MRFLAHLKNAFKLTNLTYPHKNSLNYACVAIGGCKSNQKRYFASKTSGNEINGDDGFQKAFAVLSLIRDNSRQVELVTENLEKPTTSLIKKDGENQKSAIIPKNVDEPEKNNLNEIRSGITFQNPSKSLPVNLKMEINEIPVSCMEKEMTNLKKALLNPSNLLKAGKLKESNLYLSTNTRSHPYDTTTIPIHLNTLISGTVDYDSKKIPKNHLKNVKIPEFNEYLTSLAANLCSAALQSESCRKYYSTENTIDANSSFYKLHDKKNDKVEKIVPSSEELVQDLMKKYDEFQNKIDAAYDRKRDHPHIVCVGDDKKGCISLGNAGNAPYSPKKANELEKPQETQGVLSGLGLLDPQLYKKSLKEAENKKKELAKVSREKLNIRACQSKKITDSEIKDPCKSTAFKCSDSKCGNEMKSTKCFESLTEPSSAFKCGSKIAESKCESEKLDFSKCSSEPKQTCGYENAETTGQSKASSCCSDGIASKLSSLKDESKDPCKMPKSDNQKDPFQTSPVKSKENLPGPEKLEQKDPCTALPKYGSKQNKRCTSKSQEVDSKSRLKKDSSKIPQTLSKCGSKLQKSESSKCSQKISAEEKTEAQSSVKPESKAMTSEKVATEASKYTPNSEKTSLKCSSKSELKLEDPFKTTPAAKSKLCGSSSVKEDPCKVPPINFKKAQEKSASASKCSTPSKPKCQATKEEQPSPCVSRPTKCSFKTENSKDACKKPSEATSKCSSKCSSSQKESLNADSKKACKRVGIVSTKSCDSEQKNPCKSPCDSMTKPKPKCGRPPRGDTRPRCKKDSKCGSKKPSPCASKEKPESKCGTETKSPAAKPSKCGSKTCAPSPKTSKTEIKPKSTCSSKSKTAPSSGPPKRKLHSLSNFSIPNLIFSRNFSDDCPEKPKGDYKLESERSDEYRRETCENFSWKASKPRKKRINKPKNCYPEETQEFCPDTACYKVYAETSGKADKKKGKKKPKGNKMKKNEALCTKNPFDHQKRNLSSKARENEEALIQKPHSICTRRLTLPDISDNDALICIDSVALSDTDIHMFETGARHTPSLTLGNEAAGVVTEVGRSIRNLKPGDHVVLESGIPCFKCDLCKIGRYNLCNNISFKGFLKNQCIHPASFCHKICQPIPLEQAALIPQLALGCNACYQAAIKPNSNVVIIGTCAKTVCAAICAISMGAENVCVMCDMPETRILIEQFVTQKVNCFDSSTNEKSIVRAILGSLGTFPDIVINFSACTKTMNAAIIALKPAGECIVAGFLSECVSYNIMEALVKEIRIIPSFRSKNMFPKAIHLLESGRAPLDCLIANCELCKWKELEGAFKLALSEGNNGPRKAIVKCNLND